jgi:hypothetical protein
MLGRASDAAPRALPIFAYRSLILDDYCQRCDFWYSERFAADHFYCSVPGVLRQENYSVWWPYRCHDRSGRSHYSADKYSEQMQGRTTGVRPPARGNEHQ